MQKSKTTIASGIFLLIAAIFLFNYQINSPSKTYAQGYYPKNQNNGLVFLELFSSQGCNSCPPADKLLDQIQQTALQKNQNIIYLNFHIDYWNYLGWVDPYSKHQYTDRQYLYSNHFGMKSVYTPQLVINGEQQMVGSKEAEIQKYIELYLNKKPRFIFQGIKTVFGDDSIKIKGNIVGLLDNKWINFALLENESTTVIKSGENKGLDLKNTNIVRDFFKTDKQVKNEFNHIFIRPDDLTRKNTSIVVYIQDRENFSIEGGTIIHLNE